MEKMTKVRIAVAIVVGLVTAVGYTMYRMPVREAPRQVELGGVRLTVEVASTEAVRAKGLSGRPSLLPDVGMLFVFDGPAAHCFWMRDTNMPLTALWLDKSGAIVEMQDMVPQTDDRHCPAAQVQFALEVSPEFVKRAGVRVGSTMRLI